MDYRKIKGVKHYVFDDTRDFNNFFTDKDDRPNVCFDWRAANEGEWVLADDGGVIQLLKKSNIRHPNDRRNYKYCESYVRTVVGTFLCLHKTYMDTDFSQHKNRYTFSKSIKSPNTNFYKRDKTTKKEKIFATNIAVGMGAVKSYMDAFIELDSYKAGKKAAILLRQERVMKEVEQSVVDVAKTMGVDHEYVLVTLKTLVDSSQEDNIVLNAVKELGRAIGTIGGITVKQRDTGIIGLFQGFEPEQLESAKRPEIEEGKDITENNEKMGD
jgi:hypothetical protein